MNRKQEINDRLSEIVAEMNAITGKDVLTDDDSAQFDALEAEASKLKDEKSAIESGERVAAMKAVAEQTEKDAKASQRFTTPSGAIRVRDAVADDPRRGFRNFAEYVTEITENWANPHASNKLMRVAAGTGMTQAVNADGGVFVPPAFSKAIWDRVMQKSNSLLQYCDPVPIDQGVESVTVPALAETSRVDGSRQGGIRGYWKSELTALTSSKPTFREVKLSPNEVYVFAYISDKLLRNAPGTAASMLEQGCADEIAFKIGDSIINGDGAGKPVGVIGHAGTLSISKETSQAAATILIQNLRKMNARLHPNWKSGAAWFVNPDVLPAIESLVFEVGTGGIPAYLPPGGLSASPYSQLYGMPVIPIEYCATLGTVGDIILGNFKAYAVAVKGLQDTAWSMHLKFDYAQSCYRVIFEMDGQPWLNSVITPYKGSNTLSPFVTLATRS